MAKIHRRVSHGLWITCSRDSRGGASNLDYQATGAGRISAILDDQERIIANHAPSTLFVIAFDNQTIMARLE